MATSALVLWGWHHFSIRWIHSDLKQDIFSHVSKKEKIETEELTHEEADEENFFFRIISQYKWALGGFLLLIAIFIFVSFIVEGFFSGRTLVSFLIFLGFIILASVVGSFITVQKNVFIGICVLIGLFIIGSLTIPGFLSILNMKSMLVFAAFLGLATIGQTLVALLGGLDLSIPFIIGSSNIALMSMISKGVPPWLAGLVVLLFGLGTGLINGILSFRLQGQALILTLGVGFFMVGGVQILVAMNTFSAGTVFGVVPEWMRNIASMNGKTIEIDNTDAEGRLVLADALTYALSQGADKIVDVATLTGAVHVALGDKCVGAFGNNSEFTELVTKSGFKVGERIWEMPTYPEYKDQLKSDVADIKNAGGSGAGATTGALFIGEFAGDSQWVHLDIAAVSKSSATKGFTVKGATGSGMITLISLCDKLASNSE